MLCLVPEKKSRERVKRKRKKVIPISANVANSNTSERIRLNDKKLDEVRYFVILLSFGSHGCLVFLLHDISDTFSPQKVNLLTLQL